MSAVHESSAHERFTLLPTEYLADEQCRTLADRFAAYRLPDREVLGNQARDKSLDPLPPIPSQTSRGSQSCVRVWFKRRVVRVGYRFEQEMPDEQLNALCRRVVARNAGLSEEQVQDVIRILDRKNPYRSARYHIGPQVRWQLINWFSQQPDALTTSYQMNSVLISSLRTLWYLDAEKSGEWYRSHWQAAGWPEPDGWTGWITGYRPARCGVWNPPSGWGEDYESASLLPAYQQALFKVELQGTRVYRYPWRDTWTDSVFADYDYTVLVHPQDIVLLDEGKRWER